MKQDFIAMAILGMFIACAVFLTSQCTRLSDFHTINKSSVGLKLAITGQNFCSGTIIKRNRILTASHCVIGKGMAVYIQFSDNKIVKGRVIKKSPFSKDLALIKVNTSKRPSIEVTCDLPQQFSRVKSVGYPSASEVAIAHEMIYNGIDSILTFGFVGFHERTASTKAVFPGFSGGGIINESGKLFSVVSAAGPMVTYGSKPDDICEFLSIK